MSSHVITHTVAKTGAIRYYKVINGKKVPMKAADVPKSLLVAKPKPKAKVASKPKAVVKRSAAKRPATKRTSPKPKASPKWVPPPLHLDSPKTTFSPLKYTLQSPRRSPKPKAKVAAKPEKGKEYIALFNDRIYDIKDSDIDDITEFAGINHMYIFNLVNFPGNRRFQSLKDDPELKKSMIWEINRRAAFQNNLDIEFPYLIKDTLWALKEVGIDIRGNDGIFSRNPNDTELFDDVKQFSKTIKRGNDTYLFVDLESYYSYLRSIPWMHFYPADVFKKERDVFDRASNRSPSARESFYYTIPEISGDNKNVISLDVRRVTIDDLVRLLETKHNIKHGYAYIADAETINDLIGRNFVLSIHTGMTKFAGKR